MVRSGYAAVKAVRKRATVLIGNTSSTGGARGRGPVPPLEFLRELACVDAKLRPRVTGDCAGYTTLPGDGWAHHPYSQNERPERVSKPKTEPGDLRLADTPVLAKTLNALVKMGRLAPANKNIYLTEFGYETKGIPGRPRVNETQQARWMTWAEYIADRVPTVKSFSQFLLRDQPPAPVRVSQSDRAPVRRVLDRAAAHRRQREGHRAHVPRRPVRPAPAQGPRAALRPAAARRRPEGRRRCSARSAAGRGRASSACVIDGRRAFERSIVHKPGASYRLTYPGADGKRARGLAIKPVPAAR